MTPSLQLHCFNELIKKLAFSFKARYSEPVTPPLSSMTELLSVRDARKYTGKSESTLKRMLREIAADPQHEDRGLIEPSHDVLEEKKKNGEPYHWRISKELLDKRYPANEQGHATSHDAGRGAEESSTNGPSHHQLVELLQTQLASKDAQLKTLETQLDRKDEQISNLNDRLSEGNVLMQTLQKRLNLAAPENDRVITVDRAMTPDPTSKQDGRRSLMDILKSPLFRK